MSNENSIYDDQKALYLKDLELDNEKLLKDINYLEDQILIYRRSIENCAARIALNMKEISRTNNNEL